MTTTTPPVPPTGPTALDRVAALRWAAWLVPVHAALLVWGTWEHQPAPATEFADWARFVTTDRFVWSHVVASIVGQTAAVLGTAAVTVLVLVRGGHGRRAVVGFVTHTVGSALMIAGFGVAAMAQPAIGGLYDTEPAVARDLYDAVYGPLTFVLLLTGLALYSMATLWTGSALTPLQEVPTWARRAFAASGPVFGVVGFLVGPVQTAGALLMLVASATVAARLARRD